jgi:sigma-B regulation protein RsbU (phosphoserine phosphatase)
MPVDPTIDLLQAVVGSLILTIGLLALAFALARRWERTLLWFGLLTVIYGLRLSTSSSLVRSAIGLSDASWIWLTDLTSYAILVPGARLITTIMGPGWHGMLERLSQALATYMVAAIAYAILRGQSDAAMWTNPPAILISFGIGLVHVLAYGRRLASAAAWIAIGGGSVFSTVVLYETLARRYTIFESIAMLLFIGTLGYFVADRIAAGARKLSAVERELDLARQIQRSILPVAAPDVPGLTVAARYLPIGAVAGDFYDFDATRRTGLGLLVADVSGHGVPAALVASMVKVSFAAEAARVSAPGALLDSMNRTLYGKFERAYVTACCAVVDPVGRRIAYAVAGHPPPFLRRGNGRLERLAAAGLPLAMFPEAPYTTFELPLGPGDRLVFFSDGLTEAGNAAGDFFGDARLPDLIAGATDLDAVAFADRLIAELHSWIGPRAALQDDVTLVVVDVASAQGLRSSDLLPSS